MPSHLRLVAEHPDECRTRGCQLAAQPPLWFCAPCEAVYDAARELRERLLARRAAHLRARHPVLLEALAPATRDRLVIHMAARTAADCDDRAALSLAGLDDFLSELQELGLS